MTRAERWAVGLVGALAAVSLVAGLWRAAPDTVDDAYITFRAVANFLDGEGLGFNPGEPVECFSNPLLVLLLIPSMGMGIPPEAFTFVLGLLAHAATVIVVGRAAWLLTESPVMAWSLAAAALGWFPLLYYGVTGLETGLFAALIVAAAWRAAGVGGIDAVGALLWLGVALSRPEAPLYPLAMGVAVLAVLRGRDRAVSFGWLVAVGLVYTAFLGLRWWYYGEVVPNTFHAKPPGSADLDPNTSAAWASMQYVGLFVWILGGAAPLLAAWGVVGGIRDWKVAAFAAPLGAGLFFGVYTGGDWFPAARYLVPVAPVILVLAGAGAARLPVRWREGSGGALLATGLATTVLTGSTTVLAEFITQRPYYPYHVMNSRDGRETGIWIRENLPPEATIAAYRIGAVGYFGDREIIDLFGLIHRDIGRAVGNAEGYHPSQRFGADVPSIRDAVLARDPDAILLVATARFAQPPSFPLYGKTWMLVRRFPQGRDQEFVLYIDAALVGVQGAATSASSPGSGNNS